MPQDSPCPLLPLPMVRARHRTGASSIVRRAKGEQGYVRWTELQHPGLRCRANASFRWSVSGKKQRWRCGEARRGLPLALCVRECLEAQPLQQ